MLEKEKSIIIISTTISICIMLLAGIENDQYKKMISKEESTKNPTEIISAIPKKANVTSKTAANLGGDKVVNTPENKEISAVLKETVKPIEIKPIEEKKNIESNKVPENSNKNEIVTAPIVEENLKKEEDTEKTAAVFKVKREDIFNELSFFDKEKLLLISTKLKSSDYKKINNLIQGDVDGQGVLSSLKILKDKLSGNDYSKIKQIFSKFINLDLVDN